ncbi:unnamed protein product [Fusarium venenatum]|uniref:Uncharacterized protein n=1 Tax=Fusarium venenatum TaxID=56646 RepID=A0A2L2T1F7_9HYPO|nr:uncharacterized protein FVRRES_00924 [Fusarium venenatum]CEI64412.1 unnamed protein product [Fusarium venenatum]
MIPPQYLNVTLGTAGASGACWALITSGPNGPLFPDSVAKIDESMAVVSDERVFLHPYNRSPVGFPSINRTCPAVPCHSPTMP